MSYSEYIVEDMEYEPDFDTRIGLYELADGVVGCALPELRYVAALALGAVVVALALTIWAINKMRPC